MIALIKCEVIRRVLSVPEVAPRAEQTFRVMRRKIVRVKGQDLPEARVRQRDGLQREALDHTTRDIFGSIGSVASWVQEIGGVFDRNAFLRHKSGDLGWGWGWS